MRAPTACWVAVLGLLLPLYASVPKPAGWVPARWPWSDESSLDLLAGGPINCLLLTEYTPEFVAAAANRGVATLAILTPGPEAVAAARRALAAKVTGIALEGDFPEGVVAAVKEAAGGAAVVEIASRSRMLAVSNGPLLATYQGVWPGVSVEENGGRRAGPSGSAWIDTNTGFIRAVRAWSDAPLWLANQPPAKTVVAASRYLEAIADAEASGARWVVTLDEDFAARLGRREARAVEAWRRMLAMLGYFEGHPEWRAMREYGQLALVQDIAKGGLVSGGILDMLAVKHTPVRPIAPDRLNAAALKDATMAVNVDAGALTPEEMEILRAFTRGGGALLTGPPGWKDQKPEGDRITLDKAELERLGDIWRDVNSMVGRRNLGVRLFNVSSMLSNMLVSGDGQTAILHLVNYSDYPVENVTAQFPTGYKRATLLTPDGTEKALEIYKTEEGWATDIDKIAVCATVRLEQQ